MDIQTEVLVIGGGGTGAGVARDAALRGFDATLVERADLAEGTTGRFHGLLHSGARYVVRDPHSARECMAENVVLRRIAADCIEDTGGLFVSTEWDDPAYADGFLGACSSAGIPAEEIDVADALRREPRLNPRIRRAFTVPDAAVDAWKLVWGCARSAQEHGARILTYHRVVALRRDKDAVTGARLRNELTGEELEVEAGFTINATGAWAGTVAAMAGCGAVAVLAGKGIMIAMNHRLVNTVINRCTMPSDGDILVPIRTVSVIGTTDIEARDPDDLGITQEEVDRMLDDGERLVPGFRAARALRVWAGARPLFYDVKEVSDPDKRKDIDTRHVSRAHSLLDHRARDGVERFVTITGGKATTFRLMAEETMDEVCRQLGVTRACRTAEETLPDSSEGNHYRLGSRLEARERNLHDEQLICECELITRSKLTDAIVRRRTTNLDDIRRALRLGMGPCQGGFCMYRATGILHSLEHLDARAANRALLDFLQERWKGIWPILYGDQLRQSVLDDWIFQGLLDVEHLPNGAAREAPSAGSRGTAPQASESGTGRPVTRGAAGAPRAGRAVVVGAGVAGLVAALRLAQDGWRVTVIAKGVGSTHLSGGTIDVLGYDRGPIESPAAALDDFVARHPDHPYAHVPPESLELSVAWLKSALGDLRYVGDGHRNFLLPSAVGAPRPSAVAPQTMAAGDLRAGGPVALVGIRAFKDFHPSLAAGNLREQGAVDARAVEIDLPVKGEAEAGALTLARSFDDARFRAFVVRALAGLLEPAERVGFPAVLGLSAPERAWEELEFALEREVFEISTVPPSVPGIRMFNALRAALRRAGGRLVIGPEVVGAETADGRIEALRARSAARTDRYAADRFVLASGGWGSGALHLDSHWRAHERVLGLPVAGVPAPSERRFSAHYFDEHPMAGAGVAVDELLRPVDERGNVVYENLHAAGATLAGAVPWKEKSGNGIALVTGYRAADVIAQEA